MNADDYARIEAAVQRAVEEEFCGTYGGDDIAARVTALLREHYDVPAY